MWLQLLAVVGVMLCICLVIYYKEPQTIEEWHSNEASLHRLGMSETLWTARPVPRSYMSTNPRGQVLQV